MQPINIKYIAGFFDGEGCIVKKSYFKKNGRGKRYNTTTIRMEICNTYFTLIEKCYKFFKEGHICNIPPRKIKHGWSKPQKRWQLTHRQAYRVLKQLLPYLLHMDKIKKAKEVIKYYER